MSEIKLPKVPERLLRSLPWSMRDHVEQWMTDYARQAVREAVPEGYVLVPVEPTDAMLEAARKLPDVFSIGDEWKAMFAAAQEAKQ